MRTSILGLTGLVLAATAATPAFAQGTESTFSVSGGATVTSDYRFRGISQTDKNIAIQGAVTVTHDSGFYVGVWGSSIDEYVAAGGDQEVDLIAGFTKEFDGTRVDIGVTYYYYPGAEQIAAGYNSDFLEPYIAMSHTLGPVTGKLLAAYAPKQRSLASANSKDDNLYLALDLSGGVPNTPVALSAHVGHSFGPSLLTIGKEYTDWSLGATYTTGPLILGVSYVDTNKSLINPLSGKDISKAGVVGTLSVAF